MSYEYDYEYESHYTEFNATLCYTWSIDLDYILSTKAPFAQHELNFKQVIKFTSVFCFCW